MQEKSATVCDEPPRSWYVREWMAEMGIRQTELVVKLNWPKSKASKITNGEQRYTQDILEDLATLMGLRPFELLLHPREAKALRAIRDATEHLAAAPHGRV